MISTGFPTGFFRFWNVLPLENTFSPFTTQLRSAVSHGLHPALRSLSCAFVMLVMALTRQSPLTDDDFAQMGLPNSLSYENIRTRTFHLYITSSYVKSTR